MLQKHKKQETKLTYSIAIFKLNENIKPEKKYLKAEFYS